MAVELVSRLLVCIYVHVHTQHLCNMQYVHWNYVTWVLCLGLSCK